MKAHSLMPHNIVVKIDSHNKKSGYVCIFLHILGRLEGYFQQKWHKQK